MDPYSNPMLMQYLMQQHPQMPHVNTAPLANPSPQIPVQAAATPGGGPAVPMTPMQPQQGQQGGLLGSLGGMQGIGGLLGMLGGKMPGGINPSLVPFINQGAQAGTSGGLGANGIFWNSGRIGA